jgi:hypothetical protein
LFCSGDHGRLFCSGDHGRLFCSGDTGTRSRQSGQRAAGGTTCSAPVQVPEFGRSVLASSRPPSGDKGDASPGRLGL